jgi:superoxide reductase
VLLHLRGFDKKTLELLQISEFNSGGLDMKLFICEVCGHIEFNAAPEKCPVCFAPRDRFKQNDNIFKESEEKSKEAAPKHIPFVQVNKQCKLIEGESCVDAIVRIGEAVHPMEEKHFIQFIDCYIDGRFVERAMLTPGVYAAGCFHLKSQGSKVTIVENCNIHGYWQKEVPL